MNVNQSQPNISNNSGRIDLWMAVTAVAFLFFLQTARELIGTTYYMNLATLSLNSSVVALFALFSPFVYLFGLSRIRTRHLVLISGTTLAVSRVILGVNPPLIVYLLCAVIAVVAFGILLPALVVAFQQFSHSALHVVCAATIGAGADLAFRLLGDTFDITVYGMTAQRPTALVIVLPLALCLVAGLLFCTTNESNPTTPPRVNPLLGFSTGAVGFLYFVLLGYPNNVARWVDGPYFLAAALSGAALGGAVLVWHTRLTTWLTSGRGVITGSIALLAALISCAIVPVPVIAVLLCSIALFFLPVQFYHTVSYLMQLGVTVRQVSIFLGTAAVALIIFILLSVFSLNYAYVPGMGILRNQISTIIIAAGIVSLLVFAHRTTPAHPKRKIHLSTAALGIIIIAGTWSGAALYQSHPEPGNDNLTVMTYNIQQGFNTAGKIDPWEVLEPITRIAPDILGLQESDTNRISSTNVDIVQWLAHKLDMYVYFGPETRYQTYGVAVLSRFPMYNTETYYLTSIGEQTVLIRADIQWKGEPVSIYVTHLGETDEDRSTQTAEILEILSENTNPKILMGDFNSLPDSEQMKAFTEVVDDAWVTAGNPLMDPLGSTSSALAPVKRIDYIMVSPVFTVRACEVIWGVYGSDHFPVWAEVVWVKARETVYHATRSWRTVPNRL